MDVGVVGSPPLALKNGERLALVCYDVVLREPRSVRQGVYGGPRVRVSQNVSFNAGAFRSAPHEEMHDMDTGDLIVTNGRLVFLGGKRTLSANLAQILHVEPYLDAVAVHRTNKQCTEMFCHLNRQKVGISVGGRNQMTLLSGAMVAACIEGLIACGGVTPSAAPSRTAANYAPAGTSRGTSRGTTNKAAKPESLGPSVCPICHQRTRWDVCGEPSKHEIVCRACGYRIEATAIELAWLRKCQPKAGSVAGTAGAPANQGQPPSGEPPSPEISAWLDEIKSALTARGYTETQRFGREEFPGSRSLATAEYTAGTSTFQVMLFADPQMAQRYVRGFSALESVALAIQRGSADLTSVGRLAYMAYDTDGLEAYSFGRWTRAAGRVDPPIFAGTPTTPKPATPKPPPKPPDPSTAPPEPPPEPLGPSAKPTEPPPAPPASGSEQESGPSAQSSSAHSSSDFLPRMQMRPDRVTATSALGPTATVEQVFGDRAGFARWIIATGAMEECGRQSQYVNLSFRSKKNIAQIHPQPNGIGLVLRSRSPVPPATLFEEIPVFVLAGYTGANKSWLDGTGRTFEGKGPAIAYLIRDEVDGLGDDSKEWQEVARLLDHAKTLV